MKSQINDVRDGDGSDGLNSKEVTFGHNLKGIYRKGGRKRLI
jgi:hypothetical protein